MDWQGIGAVFGSVLLVLAVAVVPEWLHRRFAWPLTPRRRWRASPDRGTSWSRLGVLGEPTSAAGSEEHRALVGSRERGRR